MNSSPDNKKNLLLYLLRIGDSSLILGQRLSEWCGHGPLLEEDIALTNIALDLIGQSRLFYSYAGNVEGKGRTEDDLAYLRDEREFYNILLAEQPNGDFACTMVRQFLFSQWQYLFYSELCKSKDTTVAAIAEKSLKEVTYHLRHSKEWILRLGDGTEVSHRRTQEAINDLWMFTQDLFDMDIVDQQLISDGIAADLGQIRSAWEKNIEDVFVKAKLSIPADVWMAGGSREAKHTEHLGYILAEMQFLPRAYPGTKW